MGPAPMIRMVEMSVRLGIKAHGMREIGHKKRARWPRVPLPQREGNPRARVVFRPVSTPAKPPKTGHQRGISGKSEVLAKARLRLAGSGHRSVFALIAFELRPTRFAPPVRRGCATRSPSGRSVEARPGF